MIDKLNKIIELTQTDGVNAKEQIKKIAEEMKKEVQNVVENQTTLFDWE